MRIALALVLVTGMTAHLVRAEPADPHIANARAHLDELALDLAQSELDLALRAGDSDRTRLLEIHRLLGIVHASLDRPEMAVDEFKIVLALDPAAELAAELGPKIVQPFTDARTAMQGRGPLIVKLEPRRTGSAELVVLVESDPLGMVRHARARFASERGESSAVAAGGPRITFAIPTGAMRASVAVLDPYNNRIAELDVSLAAPSTEAPAAGAPGLFARWTTWGGVALGAGAIGAGFALAARSTRSELDELEAMANPPFSTVEELDDRGRRRTLYANIAFGVAAVTAVVSTVLFVRRPSARTTIAALPTSNGGLVVIGAGF